jgi:hypothetical protein
MSGKKEKKEKKEKWVDDGRVIANMNVDGMPGTLFRPKKRRRFDEFGQTAEKREPLQLTGTERRAISRGVTLAFIAVLLGVIALFAIVALFISRVWLA